MPRSITCGLGRRGAYGMLLVSALVACNWSPRAARRTWRSGAPPEGPDAGRERNGAQIADAGPRLEAPESGADVQTGEPQAERQSDDGTSGGGIDGGDGMFVSDAEEGESASGAGGEPAADDAEREASSDAGAGGSGEQPPADPIPCEQVGSGCGRVWYVDAANVSNPETGATWTTAFTSPQAAMDVAQAGDSIWIAGGLYLPSTPGAPVLTMAAQVSVFGGFAAGTTSVDGRQSPSATVLSGDFEQNDDAGVNRQDNSQHVVIAAAGSVLDGLTLRGGYSRQSPVGGGGLLVPGVMDVVIRSVHFVDNETIGDGGGLHVQAGSTGVAEKCTFSSNRATRGGAVASSSSDFALMDDGFQNNVATVDGGAILGTAELADRWVIASSEFSGNQAERGGAIVVSGDQVRLRDLVFTDNQAASGGAVFFDEVKEAELISCNFVDNHTQAESGRGGAVYADQAALTLQDVEFVGNSAADAGGALCAQGGSVKIESGAFSNNTAVDGGALRAMQATVSLGNAVMLADNVAENGGAVAVHEGTLQLGGETFLEDNEASFGGALFTYDSVVSLEDCTATGNSGTTSGGALYAWGADSLSIDRCSFEQNAAYVAPAVMAFDSRVFITESTFRDNEAIGTCGAVNFDGTTGTISDVLFERNQARGGGAFCNIATIGTASNTSLEGVRFIANSALDSNGGAVWNHDSTLEVLDSTFEGNVAAGHGGGIFNLGAVLTTRDDTFAFNESEMGGAIALQQSEAGDSSLDASGALFWGNVAATSGGALSSEAASMVLRAVTLWGNRAANGGGLATLESSNTMVGALSAVENDATAQGGAVFASESDLVVVNATLARNSAARGGAVFLTSDSTLQANSVSSFEHSASEGASAFVESGGILTLSNSALWQSNGDAALTVAPPGTSTVGFSCSPETFGSATNALLSGSPFEFVGSAPRPFLSRSGQGLPCLDIGSETVAENAQTGFAAVVQEEWWTLTTASSGVLDVDGEGATDLDAGRHYAPDAVSIDAFVVDENLAYWESRYASRCQLWRVSQPQASLEVLEVAAATPMGSVVIANVEHVQPPATSLLLTCWGSRGEPAIATAAVTSAN